MRVFIFSILELCCTFLRAQFADSFLDGDADKNPTWYFSNSDFEVRDEKLHSINSTSSGTSFAISSAFQAKNCNFFSFDVDLLLNPSSSNYADIFIASDSVCNKAQNGYFIRLGDTKDNICLYKLTNGIKSLLIKGKDGELDKSSSHKTIRIYRSSKGSIRLARHDNIEGTWRTEGLLPDSFTFIGDYVGIKIVQTGTGAIGKHYFDNFKFDDGHSDSIGPKIVSISVENDSLLTVYLNEPVAAITASAFILNNSISASDAFIDSNNAGVIHLQFPTLLTKNTSYSLQYSGLQDYTGNISQTASYPFVYFEKEIPQQGDVVFTEIMANPSPSAGLLPEIEYVELQNISSKYLNLGGCRFGDASTEIVLPDSILSPGQILLLSKNTFPKLKNSNALWIGTATYPTLNNDQDELHFTNQADSIISYIHYTQDWHTLTWKKQGGWSLERIDNTLSCVNDGNWASCLKGGGSPGLANTIASAIVIPQNRVKRIYCQDSVHLILFFQQPIDKSKLKNSCFTILENNENPNRSDIYDIECKSLKLSFNTPFKKSHIFHLIVDSVLSCFEIPIAKDTIAFGLAEDRIDSGKIMLNEILFNPAGALSDYVEIVNVSNSILDLKFLRLGNTDNTGNVYQVYSVYPDGFDFLPGDYVLLTTDVVSTLNTYPSHNSNAFVALSQMPTYANDKGTVILFNNDAQVLDAFPYSDNLHSPVIANTEGISLEKFRPELLSKDPQHWTSASQACGFGTPGTRNSQFKDIHNSTSTFNADWAWFSPDDDGYRDVFSIRYDLNEPGYFLNASVFAEDGAKVCSPFANYSLSQQGTLFWDGSCENAVISQGNYVVFLEAFHPSGKTIRQKITFSVLKKN